MRIAMI